MKKYKRIYSVDQQIFETNKKTLLKDFDIIITVNHTSDILFDCRKDKIMFIQRQGKRTGLDGFSAGDFEGNLLFFRLFKNTKTSFFSTETNSFLLENMT